MHRSFRILCTFGLALAFASLSVAQTKPASPPANAPSPQYNPMLAVHDVEVGKFYMKRGDVDGAIARFKDAVAHRPNYAEPCLLLGQEYEKKGDPALAIDYYQRYLKILPSVPESKKVRERIAALREKIKKNQPDSSQKRFQLGC